jgi:hypothetical protein
MHLHCLLERVTKIEVRYGVVVERKGKNKRSSLLDRSTGDAKPNRATLSECLLE